MTKSSPIDTSYNTHDPLNNGDGSAEFNKRTSEHGALDDIEKILFRMVAGESPPRGPSFTMEMNGIVTKSFGLNGTGKACFIVKLKQFDDFIKSSQVESDINRLKEQIQNHHEREAQFEIRVKNGDSLSTADESARKVNLEELEEDKEEMDDLIKCL